MRFVHPQKAGERNFFNPVSRNPWEVTISGPVVIHPIILPCHRGLWVSVRQTSERRGSAEAQVHFCRAKKREKDARTTYIFRYPGMPVGKTRPQILKSTGLHAVQRSEKRRTCLLSYSQAEPGRELTQPSPRFLAEPCTFSSDIRDFLPRRECHVAAAAADHHHRVAVLRLPSSSRP